MTTHELITAMFGLPGMLIDHLPAWVMVPGIVIAATCLIALTIVAVAEYGLKVTGWFIACLVNLVGSIGIGAIAITYVIEGMRSFGRDEGVALMIFIACVIALTEMSRMAEYLKFAIHQRHQARIENNLRRISIAGRSQQTLDSGIAVAARASSGLAIRIGRLNARRSDRTSKNKVGSSLKHWADGPNRAFTPEADGRCNQCMTAQIKPTVAGLKCKTCDASLDKSFTPFADQPH